MRYTVIIPFYKDIQLAKNAVLSVARQWRSINKDFSFDLECLIVNDSPDTDCSELERVFNENKYFEDYKCRVLTMPSNQGEGNARKYGIKNIKSGFFFLLDMDDYLAPLCVTKCNEIIKDNLEKKQKISFVEFPFDSFDNGYNNRIQAYSIWVQSKCYNVEFINKYNIFSCDSSSRKGADYNFISKLHYVSDYFDEQAKNNEGKSEWLRAIVPEEINFSMAYWTPNEESQTRNFPNQGWGTYISPQTTINGVDFIDFREDFDKKHNRYNEQREFYKSDILNKATYAFVNMHDYLRRLTTDDYFAKRVIEEGYHYSDFINGYKGMADRLKPYIDEIWDSDVWCQFEGVKHRSDAHWCENWFDFKEYINGDLDIFKMNNMQELVDYCKMNYSFDSNGLPLHSPQYKKYMEKVKRN